MVLSNNATKIMHHAYIPGDTAVGHASDSSHLCVPLGTRTSEHISGIPSEKCTGLCRVDYHEDHNAICDVDGEKMETIWRHVRA